jgi:hypothetical protein
MFKFAPTWRTWKNPANVLNFLLESILLAVSTLLKLNLTEMPHETFICRGVDITITLTPYDLNRLANVTVSVLALNTANANSMVLL